MGQPLSGPGLGLPIGQNLYPSQLQYAPPDASGNAIALSAGDELPIPAGNWFVDAGMYGTLEYLNPQTGTWSMGPTAAWRGGWTYVVSDGFNVRVANRLGCPISSVVAAYGSAYVQGTTTITQTPGNGTWVPIVGGQLTLVGGTLTSNGAGYGVAPLVFIPPPPPAANNANGVGGVQASAYAVIASGTVSGITFTNPGAGYPTAPTPVIIPNPTDPNINTGITQAVVAFSLTGSGSITGAFCTNPGAPLSNPNQISLVLAGAGSSGSLTANVLQTVTVASVSGVGTGYGASAAPMLSTTGGVPPTGSVSNNPDALYLAWRPRQAQIGLTVNAGGTLTAQLGAIFDGGLFLTNTAPTAVILNSPNSNGSLVAATVALTMGSRPIIVSLQPAP